MDYAWARVFMLIGPGEHPDRLVPSVTRNLLRGEAARCSSGVQVRDFMDVRDCGSAFATLARCELSGPVNVCSGNPISIGDVVNHIGLSLNRPDLVHLGALPDRPAEARNLWGDATRLLQETHYRPRYSLAASIDSSIDYWRSRHS
jgi:nucleoside-diphosphate-sugar epimerase